MLDVPQNFRLLELPREIRNQVYEQVLCSFQYASCNPVRNMLRVRCRAVKEPNTVYRLKHTIGTAILCSCKQVYQEAYDAMIRSNRFIRIRTDVLPMEMFLRQSQFPVVTMNKNHVKYFKGYLVGLHIRSVDPVWAYGRLRQSENDYDCTFIILARHWADFCTLLDHLDIIQRQFRTWAYLTLKLLPYPSSLAYISFDFLKNAQKALLSPFRAHLHRFENVRIHGAIHCAIPPDLIAQTLKDTSKRQWIDPNLTTHHLEQINHQCQHLSTSGLLLEAIETWMLAIATMKRIRFGYDWTDLVAQGGDAFLKKFRNLFLFMLYEKVQCTVHAMRLCANGPHARLFKHQFTAISILALRSEEGTVYQDELPNPFAEWPDESLSPAALAAEYCSEVMRDMSISDHLLAERALHLILLAIELAPDNTEYREEKNRVLAWMANMIGHKLFYEGSYV